MKANRLNQCFGNQTDLNHQPGNRQDTFFWKVVREFSSFLFLPETFHLGLVLCFPSLASFIFSLTNFFLSLLSSLLGFDVFVCVTFLFFSSVYLSFSQFFLFGCVILMHLFIFTLPTILWFFDFSSFSLSSLVLHFFFFPRYIYILRNFLLGLLFLSIHFSSLFLQFHEFSFSLLFLAAIFLSFFPCCAWRLVAVFKGFATRSQHTAP